MNIDCMLYQPPIGDEIHQRLFRTSPVPHYAVTKSNVVAEVNVYYHGNAMLAAQAVGTLDTHHLGPSVNSLDMYIEYPGYGPHPIQTVSSDQILYEVKRLASWIIDAGYKTRIVGQSIGTGPASYLAYLLKDSGLVRQLDLVTPFTNLRSLAMEYTLFGLLVWNYYPNEDYLAEIAKRDIRVFIHHGTEDEIIPYSHAIALGAYGQLQSYQGANHNNLPWRRRLAMLDHI
jgi:fermentation-respiration switch protein FrsA (DUF1100 family)